jgi:hypothetical protein
VVEEEAAVSELLPQDLSTYQKKGALSPLFSALITHSAGPYCFEFQRMCYINTEEIYAAEPDNGEAGSHDGSRGFHRDGIPYFS